MFGIKEDSIGASLELIKITQHNMEVVLHKVGNYVYRKVCNRKYV